MEVYVCVCVCVLDIENQLKKIQITSTKIIWDETAANLEEFFLLFGVMLYKWEVRSYDIIPSLLFNIDGFLTLKISPSAQVAPIHTGSKS